MTLTAAQLSFPERILDEEGELVEELPPELDDDDLRDLLLHMLRVRCLDARMLKLQRAGRVGFVGTVLGMEGYMIGTAAALQPQDWLWSGLREVGAALSRGLPLSEYVAQMYCNSGDTAKGRQMCSHHQHKESNYPSWSSVIGTQILHAVGAAFAARRRGSNEVHSAFFGDGATSSNGFHSGMNFAGVWKVPVVFVCVDNGWAISVPSSEQTAAAYEEKAVAYGFQGHRVDGNDVLACYRAMKVLTDSARAGGGPSLLVCRTYRMLGHSSADDPTRYRDPEEAELWATRDPVSRYTRFLVRRGVIADGESKRIEEELTAEIDAEIHRQEAADPMPLKSLVEDVYAEVPRHLRRQFNDFLRIAERHGEASPGDGEFPL